MNIDYCKVATLGLKVLIGIAVGSAVVLGIVRLGKELMNNSNGCSGPCEQDGNNEDFPPLQPQKDATDNSFESRINNESLELGEEVSVNVEDTTPAASWGQKVIVGIQYGQIAMMGLLRLVDGFSSVMGMCNNLLNRDYYRQSLLTMPTDGYNDYQIISRATGYNTDVGLGYDVPTFQGRDSGGRAAVGIRRGPNTIDVY